MSITVFLADDHAVVRDGLKALLEADPEIKVVGGADNGRDAVLQVIQLKPEVVIMDIAMPELNGIEAAQQILEAEPAIHVIILSMHSTSEHIFRALQVGSRGYLLKESAGSEVVHAVHAVKAGQRYMSKRISDDVVAGYLLHHKTSEIVSPLERLSQRERQIFQLVAEGKSSATIAESLFLSPKTVDTYRSRLMKKLDVDDYASLIKFAIEHNIIST